MILRRFTTALKQQNWTTILIEFVLLVPVLVLLFGVVVGGARVWLARGVAEQAAAAAARARARRPWCRSSR